MLIGDQFLVRNLPVLTPEGFAAVINGEIVVNEIRLIERDHFWRDEADVLPLSSFQEYETGRVYRAGLDDLWSNYDPEGFARYLAQEDGYWRTKLV